MTETAASNSPIAEETVVSRNTNLVTAPVHDEIVMMDVQNGHYFGLDDIGSVIWQRLETPQTFGALVDSLAEEFDADRDLISADIATLLTQMAGHKVVNLG